MLLTQHESKAALEAVLAAYLMTCPWFNRTQKVQATQITEVIPLLSQALDAQIVLLQVDYFYGNSETCLLLLAYAEGEQAIQRLAETSQITERPSASRVVF